MGREMTVDEMRTELRKFCIGRYCEGCPLEHWGYGCNFLKESDSGIEERYRAVMEYETEQAANADTLGIADGSPADAPTAGNPADETTDPRVRIFREIVGQMADVYRAKNHDYGNSFALLRERYPNAVLIRLFDKLNRLDVLMGGEDPEVAESVEDTLLDLANYAVMELVERRMEHETD